MADISDIEQALLAFATQIAYPLGTASPSAILDNTGTPHAVQLYRGWPVPSQLDVDMAAGTVDVSIFPMRVEQNVTRYSLDWQPVTPLPSATLTLTATATTLTVGGTVSTPQNVAAIVNGFGYSYAVQPGDTLTSVATALSSLINATTAATSSGPVITVPSAVSMTPRVGVVGTALQEVKRQKRNVMISLWCPSPDLRDSAGKLFDAALGSLEFLSMPDGTQCRIIYVGSPITDGVQKENFYRRDLVYSCEYGTTNSMAAPSIVIEELNVTGGIDPNAPPIETLYL